MRAAFRKSAQAPREEARKAVEERRLWIKARLAKEFALASRNSGQFGRRKEAPDDRIH
jgi:hypothetical protein